MNGRVRWGLVLILAGLVQAAPAEISSNRVRLTQSIRGDVRGDSIGPDEIASVGPSDAQALVNLGLPAGRRVDACAVVSNRLFFSTDTSFTRDGVTYDDEDVVRVDPTSGVFTLFFDGSSNGVPAGADVDAISFAGRFLLLSFDAPVSLPGPGTVRPEDVIVLDDSGFIVAFDGETDLNLTRGADLDALAVDTSLVYYSASIAADVAGRGSDKTVWMFHPVTRSITNLLDGETAYGMAPGADLDGLDDMADNDNDMLTDWEELTGLNEPAYSWMNKIDPDPAGTITDPWETDTDGDMIPDGEEALAGTHPLQETSYLHVVQIADSGSNALITWSSAAGRKYRLQQAGSGAVYDGMAFTNLPPTFSEVSGDGSESYTVTNGLGSPSGTFWRVQLAP